MSDTYPLKFPNRRPVGPTFQQENKSFDKIRSRFSESAEFTLLEKTSNSVKLLLEQISTFKDAIEDKEGFVYIDENITATLQLDYKRPDQVICDVVVISKHIQATVLTLVEDTTVVDKTITRYNKMLAGKLILSMLHFTSDSITTLCTVLAVSKSKVLDKEVLKHHLNVARKRGSMTRTANQMHMDARKRNESKFAMIGVLAFSNDAYNLDKSYEDKVPVLSMEYEDFCERYQDVSNSDAVVSRLQSTEIKTVNPTLDKEITKPIHGLPFDEVLKKTGLKTLEIDDESEQENLRNSLRISGVDLFQHENPMNVALLVLQLVCWTISPADIHSCHRQGWNKDIIVKFVNHEARKRVLENRYHFKNTGVYINEILTPFRGKLFKLTRNLKAKNKIATTWTSDGNIYVKEKKGEIKSIKCKEDIERICVNFVTKG